MESVDVASLIGNVVFNHCFGSSNKGALVLNNFSFCNKIFFSWSDEPLGCLVPYLWTM